MPSPKPSDIERMPPIGGSAFPETAFDSGWDGGRGVTAAEREVEALTAENSKLRAGAIEALGFCREAGEGDPESAHAHADIVLCDLLRSLGYADVVESWEAVKKWYA